MPVLHSLRESPVVQIVLELGCVERHRTRHEAHGRRIDLEPVGERRSESMERFAERDFRLRFVPFTPEHGRELFAGERSISAARQIREDRQLSVAHRSDRLARWSAERTSTKGVQQEREHILSVNARVTHR